MKRAWERKKATELKAADARTVVKFHLPAIAELLTAEQLDKVQRVLDYFVVNLAIKKEIAALESQAVISDGRGGRAIINADKKREADKKFETLMVVSESDMRLRLDFKKLLSADALKPRSDNPDEAAFLLQLHSGLVKTGIWLRFGSKLRAGWERNTNPNPAPSDASLYRVWLSYGSDGDEIPMQSNKVTREALLKVPLLARAYYEWVYEGRTYKFLHASMDILESQIRGIFQIHHAWHVERTETSPHRARVSDFVSGADFPPLSIWDAPRQFLSEARKMENKGSFQVASSLVVMGGILANQAGQMFHQYIRDTSKGAARVVSFFRIVDEVANTVEKVFIVRAIGVGLWRTLAKETGTEVGATVARKAAVNGTQTTAPTRGVVQPQNRVKVDTQQMLKPGSTNYAGPEAYDQTLIHARQGGNTLVTGSGHTGGVRQLSRLELVEQSRFQAYQKEMSKEIQDYMKQHGGASVPMWKMQLITKRLRTKWEQPQHFSY